MRKLVCILCILGIFISSVVGCSSQKNPEEKQLISIAALKGPTAMGMVKLIEDDKADQVGPVYDFTIAASLDEITPQIVQGNIDIAAVPANLASILYHNTKGQIYVLAINTLGVLYLVESGDTISSIADLKGKTIYTSGKGATPEYALNYLLRQNGLEPQKDVTIEYKSEHSECVAALVNGENKIAMLPQPFVTTVQNKNENIRIALDLNQEWENLQEEQESKSALITGVVIANKEFVDQNPKEVACFFEEYKASVDYVNSNVKEAAALIEAYDIVGAEVAEIALPFCNITMIEGKEMKGKLEAYLKILFAQEKESVGGKLPDEGFYYER